MLAGHLTTIGLLACVCWCSGIETVHLNVTASTSTSPPTRSANATSKPTVWRSGWGRSTTVTPKNAWSQYGRPRNDHDEIKALINHVVDGVLQKIDVNQAIYMNELSATADAIISSFGQSLRELNARMKTLEMLSHQIDELTDYKNNVDTKLFRLNDNTEANQMLTARLNDLQHNVDDVRTQMDHVIERTDKIKQRKTAKNVASSAGPIRDGGATLAGGDRNGANCETKIDQVLSFVHNVAEINRLESSDILYRLGNIQSQLVHSFHADKMGAKANIHGNSREKISMNELDQPVTEATQANLTSSLDVLETDASTALTNTIASVDLPINATPSIGMPVANRTKRSAWETFRPISAHRAANYDQPTQVGCHRMGDSTNGFYRFDAIELNRNAAGRTFNERVCLFEVGSAGWTVIQRRGSPYQALGRENFNRSWNDYKQGFGNLDAGEFWFGNDFIHQLTYDDDMELKIVLEDWTDRRIEFNYDVFRVDSERNKYNLVVDGFRGENKSLNAMAYHHGQDFSTFDRQNDRSGIDGARECCTCAVSYASGWWFNNCLEANLNGVYRTQPNNNNFVGIVWEHWLGDYSLKSTYMMVRPKVEWTDEVDENETDSNSKPPEDP